MTRVTIDSCGSPIGTIIIYLIRTTISTDVSSTLVFLLVIRAERVLITRQAVRRYLEFRRARKLLWDFFLVDGKSLQIDCGRSRYYLLFLVSPADRVRVLLRLARGVLLQKVLARATLRVTAVLAVTTNQTISPLHMRLHLKVLQRVKWCYCSTMQVE